MLSSSSSSSTPSLAARLCGGGVGGVASARQGSAAAVVQRASAAAPTRRRRSSVATPAAASSESSGRFQPSNAIAPSAAPSLGVNSADEFTKDIVETENRYILQTYARPEVVFVKGQGSTLWDAHGNPYLDFTAGIAVNSLGHGHPSWLAAVREQAGELAHVSNLYHTAPQARLARKMVEAAAPWASRAFFCNSGTEANEAAIKFARKHAKVKRGVDPYDASVPPSAAPFKLLSFDNCFHGRTLGALALTYKVQYKTPFEPIMPGVDSVPYLDLAAAEAVLAKGETCAVFVEPLQGEGGVFASSKEFLEGLRRACDRHGALLVYDEVQVGLGRTGSLWAHQQYGSGCLPDIMTLAKPLAGGLPIGAALMTQAVADAMAPGDHGSTFAGNPLVCHAAEAAFDVINDPAFLKNVVDRGEQLRSGLKAALKGVDAVVDVRGRGLISGVQLDRPAGNVCTLAREKHGLLVLTAGKGDVVRLVPPLVLTEAEVDEGVQKLAAAIKEDLAA